MNMFILILGYHSLEMKALSHIDDTAHTMIGLVKTSRERETDRQTDRKTEIDIVRETETNRDRQTTHTTQTHTHTHTV